MNALVPLLPLLIAGSACERVIEPDLPEQPPQLVVHSLFTSDGPWTARVGRSSGILQPVPSRERPVPDAEVELLGPGNRVLGKLKFDETSDVYVFEDPSLQAGETYSLQVSAPGFETVRAADTVPKPVPTSILSYRTHTSSRSGSGGRGDYSVKLEIEDPPGEANYYQVSLFRVSGGRVAFRMEYGFSTKDPSILAANRADESPFEEGTFEGEAVIFKDTLFDGRTHQIELTFRGPYENLPPPPEEVDDEDLPGELPSGDFLQVLFISENYYQYIRTVWIHDLTRDNPFAEPLSVHGNVENGYGVFAGYSSRTFELTLEEE